MSRLDAPPEQLWCVGVAYERGAASWGAREFFEDADEFHQFMLEAMLDIDTGTQGRASESRLRSFAWRRAKRADDDDNPKRVRRIQGVWRLVGSDWVEYDAHLSPPEIAVVIKDTPA